jgi:serine/threonine protein kinase
VEANDPNPYVAVKVLNDDFRNHPDAFVTLQREASRSHILSHPNIVTVHDFDRDGDVIYMTMELLQGQGLEAVIRQHRQKGVAKEQALKIIRDIGLALAYAHQKHIVHSDLKPGNIFVCADSTKVLDFGIARLTNQSGAVDFDAGSLGALTPAYASLEMINGDEPHPADDVYACAIIAYELFTGEHPYQRKPADVALREKLRPAPVRSLNKQQWKTLEGGLKLRRSERIQDVVQFYKGLTQKRRSIKGLLAATVLFTAVAATVAYRLLVGDELQTRVAETYQKGVDCLASSDYQCALDSAKAVLQMDAENNAASDLLLQAAEQLQAQQQAELLARFDQCAEAADASCVDDVLRRLRNLPAEATRVENLQARWTELQRQRARDQVLIKAQKCAQVSDWNCVTELTQAALQESEDAELRALLTAAEDAETESRQARAQQRQLLEKAMRQAEECLAQQNYDCAEEQAQAAVAMGIDPVGAQTLAQRVAFARAEHESSLRKAKNVLAKGESCLQKKNYSCAIASSDSALEFVPDYPPALQLRAKAQQAVERLKSQIVIE